MRVDDVSSRNHKAKMRVESFPVSIPATITKRHAVSFDNVEIRRYQLILGDNPFTEVPLALGWNYHYESENMSVDAHEARKLANESYVHAQYMEPMDVSARQARLRGVGYSNAQIRQEERKRRITVLQEWAYRFK